MYKPHTTCSGALADVNQIGLSSCVLVERYHGYGNRVLFDEIHIVILSWPYLSMLFSNYQQLRVQMHEDKILVHFILIMLERVLKSSWRIGTMCSKELIDSPIAQRGTHYRDVRHASCSTCFVLCTIILQFVPSSNRKMLDRTSHSKTAGIHLYTIKHNTA